MLSEVTDNPHTHTYHNLRLKGWQAKPGISNWNSLLAFQKRCIYLIIQGSKWVPSLCVGFSAAFRILYMSPRLRPREAKNGAQRQHCTPCYSAQKMVDLSKHKSTTRQACYVWLLQLEKQMSIIWLLVSFVFVYPVPGKCNQRGKQHFCEPQRLSHTADFTGYPHRDVPRQTQN